MPGPVNAKKLAWLGVDCIAVACTAALRFFRGGYSFEDGDQLQYLLGAYRYIYPDFVPGDWMVWHTDQYHVAYSWLITLLHMLAGEHYFAETVLGVHVLGLVWLSYAVLRVARSLGAPRGTAYLAMFAVAVFQSLTLGTNSINHNQLLAADLAHIPFLLCCAAWLRGEIVRAGVWLGVSGLLHANYATLGPILMLGAELVEHVQHLRRPQLTRAGLRVQGREQVVRLLKLFVPFALIASPTLVMVARAVLLSHADSQAVLQFLLRRAPHHYDMRTFTRREWLCPFFALVLALPTLGAVVPQRSRARAIVASGLTLLFLGYVGFRLESSVLVQLRVWRIAVPLYTFLLVLASETIVRAVRDGGWGMRAWVVPPACMFLIARFDIWFIRTSGALLAVVLPLLCLSALAMRLRVLREFAAGITALAALLGALAWYVQPTARLDLKTAWAQSHKWGKVRLRAGPGRAERDLYRRIRGHMPMNANFLAPPTLGDFRLFARRAMFVDWKSTPMRGDEALEWQRRINVTAGGPLRTRGFSQRRELNMRYAMRTAEQLARIARREHLTHVVALRDLPGAAQVGLKRMFRSGRYVVYSLDTRLPRGAKASGASAMNTLAAPKDRKVLLPIAPFAPSRAPSTAPVDPRAGNARAAPR
jgi:hypothetical protein